MKTARPVVAVAVVVAEEVVAVVIPTVAVVALEGSLAAWSEAYSVSNIETTIAGAGKYYFRFIA